jgi:Fe-S-cluster-containing dehydrogenase component
MPSRREFLKVGGTAAVALAGVQGAMASTGPQINADRKGVLCDFTLCIGCRRCEWACAKANDLPHGELASYDDTSPFAERRRPDAFHYTVVNRYPAPPGTDKPFHTKVNCLHCDHPACVSACLVKALRKDPGGPVTYDAAACVGCRYCMMACPFQIPAYEYQKALEPRVMKCSFCEGKEIPECVKICPQEAMLYGRRDELLEIAHQRITNHPERYVNHVYGEHEAGGTSWLYLADRPFDQLDLPDQPNESPAVLTETIQHGIFRGFTGPIMLFGLISVIMKSAGKHPEDANE